jgi:hypothetical protein
MLWLCRNQKNTDGYEYYEHQREKYYSARDPPPLHGVTSVGASSYDPEEQPETAENSE